MSVAPSEERRTFLEVQIGDSGAVRLLQLDPYTRFANVCRMLGPGALYWGNRPLAAGDMPARLRMPSGVDDPVDLYFEPASPLASRAGTNAGYDSTEDADDEDMYVDGDAPLTAFDPRHQPIPPVLPAHFAAAEPASSARDITGERLLSPSVLPVRKGARASPPRRTTAMSQERPTGLRHQYVQPTPLCAAAFCTDSLFAHTPRSLSAAAAHGGSALASGSHPYAAASAPPPQPSQPSPQTRWRFNSQPPHGQKPPLRRANATVLVPPPEALVDDRYHHHHHRQPLEDELRALRRELHEMRRERAEPVGTARTPARGTGDLVTTPRRAPPPLAAATSRALSLDVDSMAEEIHFQQMRRLLELRALYNQGRPARIS